VRVSETRRERERERERQTDRQREIERERWCKTDQEWPHISWDHIFPIYVTSLFSESKKDFGNIT
jgi:hypothetical protein